MIAHLHKPLFIVLEGLDGAGKTTTARALADAIGAQYMTTPAPDVRAVHAAVLDSLGESQEACHLFYLATVFAAARRVETTLARGTSVVMDRYFLSTQVYAEFRGSCFDLNKLGVQLFPAALTVFLDIPAPVRRERLAGRHCTPADRATLTTGANAGLRKLYLRKSKLAVAGRFVRLTNADASVEETVRRVMLEIERQSAPAPGFVGANMEALA